MEIKTEHQTEQYAFIRIIGKFNIEEVIQFERFFNKLVDTGVPAIIIDMSGLTYIDSSGIGSLIKLLNISKNSNIDFILSELKPEIENVFKLAYLDKFFTILPKEEIRKKYIK